MKKRDSRTVTTDVWQRFRSIVYYLPLRFSCMIYAFKRIITTDNVNDRFTKRSLYAYRTGIPRSDDYMEIVKTYFITWKTNKIFSCLKLYYGNLLDFLTYLSNRNYTIIDISVIQITSKPYFISHTRCLKSRK